MANTPNYGLYITDDTTVTFQAFRQALCGTGQSSNMMKIDGAMAALKPVAFSVIVPASGWSSGTNTVSDARFLIGDYAYIIQPTPSSIGTWKTGGVYAGDIATAGQCVFTATGDAPSADMTVYVMRVGV